MNFKPLVTFCYIAVLFVMFFSGLSTYILDFGSDWITFGVSSLILLVWNVLAFLGKVTIPTFKDFTKS